MSRLLAFVITAARVELYISTLLPFLFVFIFLAFTTVFLYLFNVFT